MILLMGRRSQAVGLLVRRGGVRKMRNLKFPAVATLVTKLVCEQIGMTSGAKLQRAEQSSGILISRVFRKSAVIAWD